VAEKETKMDRTNSTPGKLLVNAFWAALAAFVLGLCLARTLIKRFDSLDSAGMVLAGAFLIFVLFRTRRAVRPFLASCIFFSMITATLGIAVASVIWYSSDFIRTFGVACWSGFTCIAIFCVRRDAKRLTDPTPTDRS
jgi:hypothetical protein